MRWLLIASILAIVGNPAPAWAFGDSTANVGSGGVAISGGELNNSPITINNLPSPEQLASIRDAIADPLLKQTKEMQDKIDSLQRTLGANEAQLVSFFNIIGRNVPSKQMSEELIKVALQVRDLENKSRPKAGDDPQVAELKAAAAQEIEQGKFERAEKLLSVAYDQIDAVRFISEGHSGQALTELNNAESTLNDLLAKNPPDIQLKLQQGYIYKTHAQLLAQLGDNDRSEKYLDQALGIFEDVKYNQPSNKKTVDDLASTINGIGNIYHQRGMYLDAIKMYEKATDLVQNYAYAWHDMFASYLMLAEQGDVDRNSMRYALDKVKKTGVGWPRLDTSYIEKLESAYEYYAQKEKQK